MEAVIAGLFNLIWNGTVEMSRKSGYVMVLYVCLAFMTSLSWLHFDNIIIMVAVIIMVAIILGIRHYLKYVKPIKEMRAFFHKVFKEINFETKERIPSFLAMKDISKYITVYSFKTYFPLKMWLAKKDYLDMYMQEMIVDIQHDKKDKTIIHVLVENEPLSKGIKWTDEYISNNNVLNIGISRYGVVGMNLDKYPHAFVAGETGSGKSNILKCLIHQALLKEYEVVLIDFKRGVSFSEFSDEVTVYYDYKGVIEALKYLVEETIERLDKFRDVKAETMAEYNTITGETSRKTVVFIDELTELLKTRDKEISNILRDSIETLTRISRAVGIHLIMGIQRPDSTIVNGQIKNNVSYRVCGRFVDKEPSRIMLSSNIANTLPNIKGRFIVKDDNLHEVQSFYFPKGITRPARVKESNLQTIVKSEPVEKDKALEPVTAQKTEQKKLPQQFNFDFSDLRNDTDRV